MNCRNCGKAIKSHYGTFSKWIHEHGSIHCLISMAEPEKVSEELDFLARVRQNRSNEREDEMDIVDYRRTYASEYNAKRARHDFMIAGYSVGPLEWDAEGNLYWFEAIPEG